jgi:tRNA(Ile)-lysidine synthase
LNTNFISRVKAFISEKKLIDSDQLLILAVSGGMDSMAMLFCFAALRQELALKLQVVHVNHGIRIPDSDLDEKLVAEQCRNLNIPCQTFRLEGFNLASSEDALRKARYEKYNLALQSHPGARLATAHHLDDQLETLLMRLAKGSSPRGLRGIPLHRGPFVRPFLFLTRAEIENYARESGAPYREDYTNAETSKLRNAVRHRIAPVMRDVFGLAMYNGVAKSISDMDALYQLSQAWVKDWAAQHSTTEQNSARIGLEPFAALSAEQRQLALTYCISGLYPLNSTLPERVVQRFDAFLRKAQTGSCFLIRKDLQIEKERASIRIHCPSAASNEVAELSPEAAVCFGRNKIEIREVLNVNFNRDPNEEYICGDRLQFPLQVRNWRHADSFYPLGMKGRQKLSDFFIDHKVECAEKYRTPLVCNRSEVIWIVGMRLDERYCVTKESRKIYRITSKIIQG